MPHGGQEGGGVLPNGGGRGYHSSLPLCFPPLTAIFFRSKLSPSLSFPALSPLFKKLFSASFVN